MRRLIPLLLLLTIGIIVLSRWHPGTGAAPTSPTPLPADFTLIPTFVPSYPCELQIVDIYDKQLCRNERVTERILISQNGTAFIQRDYHLGAGCWGSISQDIHELHVCDTPTGKRTTLTRELVTGLLSSPDGQWLAFGTMNTNTSSDKPLAPHVFRVRPDGTDLQPLDTLGFPDFAVGAPSNLRWLDDRWLALTLWDGTGEAGWHSYRLKADGTGIYEALTED